MSEFDSDSDICFSDPFSFIEEASDDSLNSSEGTSQLLSSEGWSSSDDNDNFKFSDDSLDEDIFPLLYSEEEKKPCVDYFPDNFDMAAEVVIDLSATVQKQPKRKAKKTTSDKAKTSPIFIPDGDYGDEIIFVEPENYSPKKKLKLDEEKRTVIVDKSPSETNSDISVTFAKKGIDFPHAREHCRVKGFVQIPSLTTKGTGNEEFCEKCYCFVCDDLASKCESWNKGENPHCNSYSKNVFWERERRMHKRNTKKFKHVPITSLLPPKKITLEMTKSGSFCSKFIEQLQKVSDLSYDVLSGNTCGCYCHRDSFPNPFGCMDCSWEHTPFNTSIHRNNCQFTLQSILTESLGSIENNLRKNKPNPAITILDTVTSLLLGVDINSKSGAAYIPGWFCSRFISLWIEAALSQNVDREMLSLAKDRLSKSLQEHNCKLFVAQANVIQDILSSLKPFDDPLVVKCLTKRHKGSSSGLKEPYTVAKVRLLSLMSHQKTSEAINYILGAETDTCNALGTHRLCDFADQRDELIRLLIKEGRIQEALTVCRTNLSSALPIDLAKNTIGRSFNINSTPLKSMTPKTFEDLFLGLVRPKTPRIATGKALGTISEEGLRNAMTIVLPWLRHTNYGFLDSWGFLLNEIGAQYKKYEYPSESARKDVQSSASSFVDEKVKYGSTCFPPEDFKPPKNIPLQVFVIEMLDIVAITKVTLQKCLQSLVKKELYWACKSLLTLPRVQATIASSDVSYITKNVLPKIDCSTIPVEVLKKWLTNSNCVFHFYSLFDLVCHIFDAGDKKEGPKGVELKKKAMILSQTLMESLLIHSYGQDRSVGMINLKTLQEKFSSKTAKKLGITMSTWDPLEIEFFYNPSFQALEAIKNSKGRQNKEEFLKKQEVILKFLKKNTRLLQETVIEILIKLEMYKDLLECLNGLNSVYDGYEANFTKINASLNEMKQKGDVVKTMALVEALKDYVATALVQSSFSYSFRHHRRPIPSQVSDSVKLIHSISRNICLSVIQKAIDTVTQKYLNNTVTYQKRIELGRWLTEIKAIFTSVKENKEWLTTLTNILQGPLRRKPQIVKCLQVTSNLFITKF